LFGSFVFLLAFAILSISVFRSASPRYAFIGPLSVSAANEEGSGVEIDYLLPYPGRILPDSPLWPLKAVRDKLWHFFTFDTQKEAELSVLCSDKRLGMSKILFERGKPELAYSTLTKGEKYLEMALEHERKAREKGGDTVELLQKIANASLRHRQVIDEILNLAPEDAKPAIINIQNYSKQIYKEVSDVLSSKGITPPKDPFDGE